MDQQMVIEKERAVNLLMAFGWKLTADVEVDGVLQLRFEKSFVLPPAAPAVEVK